LSKYPEALQAKADSKNSKSEVLLKLDKWYQNELPKKIKSRGKEAHLTHEEIVQTIKWKLARGVFRPRLKDLITMNTPRVVMQETKKAYRAIEKRRDIEAAVKALSVLKGVGPAMASGNPGQVKPLVSNNNRGDQTTLAHITYLQWCHNVLAVCHSRFRRVLFTCPPRITQRPPRVRTCPTYPPPQHCCAGHHSLWTAVSSVASSTRS